MAKKTDAAQNRDAARPMPRGVRFGEGQKGNPGGRPKSLKELEELARTHTPAAILALVAALEDPARAVPAANSLLDRAWGKPKQAIVGDDGEGPVRIVIRRMTIGEDD